MKGYLHLLSEDANDDAFYKGCIEKVTGLEFESIQYWRSRSGGISGLSKLLTTFLNQIHWAGHIDNNFFIVAVDNDRCPVHPCSVFQSFKDNEQGEDELKHDTSFLNPGFVSRLPKREQNKQCRYCEFKQRIDSVLGDPWPIGGAITIPVQMLESWLLQISNPTLYPDEISLPLFATSEGAITKRYYNSRSPERQLKDLAALEKKRLGGMNQSEYCQHCTEILDPDALAKQSPSFAFFLAQVSRWKIEI